MKPIDMIILIGAITLVAFAITVAIVRKKKGKSGCGCNCNGCSGCASKNTCPTQQNDKEE